MNQVLSLRIRLILLTGILGLTNTACGSLHQTELPNQTTQVAIDTSPPLEETQLPPPSIEPDRFELALDKAYGALTISQSAQSVEDWHLIATQWREAIFLMKNLPPHSPHRAIAQAKIVQYQQHLRYAQQQSIRLLQPRPIPVLAAIPTPLLPMGRDPRIPTQVPLSINRYPRIPIQAPPSLAIPTSSGVFQAAIKNRRGGTPVVDVIFNGGEQFEMIVDTGASGTVITQQMASALGVVPIGRARANTASDRNVEFAVGNIRSIEVGGAVINNVPVAIAPTANLDMGLLGQDFFSNYDVTIKRDVVEFRPR